MSARAVNTTLVPTHAVCIYIARWWVFVRDERTICGWQTCLADAIV